eukprot:751714-Ditylum_brightwellii.AAC.1
MRWGVMLGVIGRVIIFPFNPINFLSGNAFCGCPNASRIIWIITVFCALWNQPQHSASAAEYTTFFRAWHSTRV